MALAPPKAPKITEILARSALFGGLSPDGLARVAQEMHERTFKQNRLIFARGDQGSEVYIVVEGRVRLSILSAEGRALAFRHAECGDIFGEIAVLDGGVRTADATAITRVRAMVLGQAAFNRLMTDQPEVAIAAVRFLCNRLRTTSEQLEQVALSPIEVRLARFLLHTIRMQHPAESRTPVNIDIGMSQTELGLLIGTSRQSVNAVLMAMERGGIVKRSGTMLECNVERLSSMATAE